MDVIQIHDQCSAVPPLDGQIESPLHILYICIYIYRITLIIYCPQ